MKTIVITTKNPNVEYKKIVQNWFDQNYCDQNKESIEEVEVESTIDIDTSSYQSSYNNLIVRQDTNFRIVLPEAVNPNQKQQQKAEYVLDLLCIIADMFYVNKEDLYLFVHSRDLFNLEDSRSGYGIVYNDSLSCSTSMLRRIEQRIEDGHIFQFHHDDNNVKHLLVDKYLMEGKTLVDKSLKEGETISELGKALLFLF